MASEVIIAKIVDIAITAALAGWDKDLLVHEVNEKIKTGASLVEIRDYLRDLVDQKREEVQEKLDSM